MAYYPNYYGQNPEPYRGQQSGLIWVQGEAGAKSYLVANGCSVLLMDSERQTFYIKSADASGMPSLRVYDYTERAQAQTAEYATREELNALTARLDALMKKEGKANESPV